MPIRLDHMKEDHKSQLILIDLLIGPLEIKFEELLGKKEFRAARILLDIFEQLRKTIDPSTGDTYLTADKFESLENKNPLDILAYQYDIVCNGVELSSGAIRNHKPEIMYKAFEIAGYDHSVVDTKFPALINAFRYGAPPHGGLAPGIDRIVMLIADKDNVRDVIAFPMNQRAQDLMMGAPSQVTEAQLKELNLRLELPIE